MKKKNIILISSSGGHYEQLQKLVVLESHYNLIWCTEKTKYKINANYRFPSIKIKSILFPFKLFISLFKAFYLIIKYKPIAVISTGALIAIPMSKVAKV